MSNFVIEIKAPEIVAVLEKLAAVMSGKVNFPSQGSQVATPAPAQPVPNPVPAMSPMPAIPTPTTPPVTPTATPAPIAPTAPVNPAPVPAAPSAPVNAAPVAAAPAYQLDDLSKAAAQLMDAGRQQDLIGLLGQHGVPSLMQLPKEQYGNFALALKQMGAKL